MKNVFNKVDSDEIIHRINNLTPQTQALWGKMSVDQMLAHCNVTYEMAFENIHKAPNAIMKFILKSFVKSTVVGTPPYKKNSATASEFIIKTSRDFNLEKRRLIDYINKTQQLGMGEFEEKESLSFGKLSALEWSNMFYKHLDHHLNQFGV